MTSPEKLVAAALSWRAIDPDPATRAEVDALLGGGARFHAELEDRFGSRLTFGTAGLRGALGAGPNRMNRVIVAQTSAGLAQFLLSRDQAPTAVIGYDARHNSAVFARDAAEVLAAAGVRVTVLPRALPTPVLAFAVRDLGVSAGIMITASHNPAADNGYKLYLGDADEGSQLVPPADAQVLAEIDAVAATGLLPAQSDDVTVADESLIDRYVAAAAAVAGSRPAASLAWVYTPMHGVGLETVARVIEAAGLPAPILVAAQQAPDPDFPTVSFPNPEEPGALDLAIGAAREAGAALVIANDPDADRLAVAVPDAASGSNGWRQLSGNEVGLILAWAIGSRAGAAGGVFASSIVSTPGLAALAARFGLPSAETLTGFKWISRVPGLRFGFEEALGYLVNPTDIRDKDGISAAVLLLAEVLDLTDQGRTLLDRLDEIDTAIGHFASAQVSIRVATPGDSARLLGSLRATPPTELGGLQVLGMDDLQHPTDDSLPPTEGLRVRLAGSARVIIRPSGTEPKLKAYLDVHEPEGPLRERRSRAADRLTDLREAILHLLQ